MYENKAVGRVLRKRWSRRLKISTAAMATLLTLISLEFVLRLFPCPISPVRRIFCFVDDERIYALRSNTTLEFSGVLETIKPPVLWQVNSQGIRRNGLLELNPPFHKIRLATYGDSDTFGWSVSLPDTFQNLLEARNSELEVVNLGVPGYNIANVAAHLETTLGDFNPHRILYIVHPNDFEPPLRFLSRTLIDSELVCRLAYTYNRITMVKDYDALKRDSERVNMFVATLRRMLRACQERDIELTLAFGRGEDSVVLRLDNELARYFYDPLRNRVLDLTPIVQAFPLVDGHLSADAHQLLAEFLERKMGLSSS